jgi:dihydroorotase-like cyclic amidohydrolase
MRKTLYMHFRLWKRNHNKLGMTGEGALARGGVTVVGQLVQDTIRWGAVKCFDENYDKAQGRRRADVLAASDDVIVTKNLDYIQARETAELIGHLVYRHGVTIGLTRAEATLREQKVLA